VIEAFDDPDVAGVTCYMSHARTGGIKGAVGLAEDPGEAAIACRQVGPIDPAKLEHLRSPHEVFSERASLIFKSTQVVRFWDAKRQALIYLVYTDRIIEGSPRNSISVVPVGVMR
jgi:CreA protein